MKIEFPHCTVEWQAEHRKCITRFSDGAEAHAVPHDTHEYRQHAVDKSTGNIDDYCWQHDLCHVIWGLMNGGPSIVLWAVAHGIPTDGESFEREEQQVQELQRAFFRRPHVPAT